MKTSDEISRYIIGALEGLQAEEKRIEQSDLPDAQREEWHVTIWAQRRAYAELAKFMGGDA